MIELTLPAPATLLMVSVVVTAPAVLKISVLPCSEFVPALVRSVAVPATLLVNPDLVVVTTETGALRLRGDYIAGTESVAVLCLVLLLAGVQKVSKITYGLLLGLCCVLLVASLSRSAYVILFLISLLVLFKRPRSKPFRRFAYVWGSGFVLALALDLASSFTQYRDPESIWTLSDRVGLWIYLSQITMQKSPLLGLGYYAASRVYAPQYNPDLGTAHSMFFETLTGGGIPAIPAQSCKCQRLVAMLFIDAEKTQG